ncbi:MAG: DUF2141 domain-containing protein [Planctomycetes bacterium]|nr:DUF2141 domain-containing protein [Planctomycetota bacterium]
MPTVQSPLLPTTIGIATLAFLTCCISCTGKTTSSGPSTPAARSPDADLAEDGKNELDVKDARFSTSIPLSIPTELSNPSVASPVFTKDNELGTPAIAPAQSSDSSDSLESESTKSFQVKIVGLPKDHGQCLIAVYASSRGFRNPEVAIAKETIPLSMNAISTGKSNSGVLVWSFNLPSELEAFDARSPATARNSESDENASDASPEVRLAITAFHDANGNGELDKNAFGIPTEKYGFSKNPAPGFGPPSFDQTAIPLSQWKSLDSPIEIKLR